MNAILLGAALVAPWVSPPRAAAGPASAEAAADAPRAAVHAGHEAWYEFGDHELRFRSAWHFRSGGRVASELRFALPEDVLIDDVEGAGVAGYRLDESGYELCVSLAGETGRSMSVTLVGHVPFDAEIQREAVLLPVVEPQDVEREAGRLHLFAPAGLHLTVDREFAVGAVPAVARPEPSGRPGPPGPPACGLRHVASWAYRRRPVELLVEMAREPLRLSAHVTTTATVCPRHVEVLARIEYQVESGQTDVFHVAAPATIADCVQLVAAEGADIAQATRGEETPDGQVPWTVVTREPVTDRFTLILRWELTPAARNPGQQIVLISHAERAAPAGAGRAGGPAQRVRLEPVLVFDPLSEEGRPAHVQRVSGVLAIRVSDELDVVVSPLAGRIERVFCAAEDRCAPPLALASASGGHSGPLGAPGGEPRLVRTDRYDDRSAAWELAWSRARPPAGPPPRIERAVVEVLLAAAGRGARATYRCEYDVVSSGLEPLRLELPASPRDADFTIRRASCNGRPVVLHASPEADTAGRRAFRLELPRPSTGGTEPFSVALEFQTKLAPGSFGGFGGRLELPLPRIGGSDDAVPELHAVVCVPRPYVLVGVPAGFERVPAATAASPLDGRCVLRRTGGDDVVVVTWWNHAVATWVLSVAALLIAIVLRPTSWRNRVSVVVLMGFAAAMAAVVAADAVRLGLLAARPGVVAGALLWAAGALPARGRAGV